MSSRASWFLDVGILIFVAIIANMVPTQASTEICVLVIVGGKLDGPVASVPSGEFWFPGTSPVETGTSSEEADCSTEASAICIKLVASMMGAVIWASTNVEARMATMKTVVPIFMLPL